jgi:fibro-slime domain-containing protein
MTQDATTSSPSDLAAATSDPATQPDAPTSSLESVLTPSATDPLAAQGESGLPDAKGGLVIDGDALAGATRLCIKADPVRGHAFEGKVALRFFTLVYDKNSDGTYAPAGKFGSVSGKNDGSWDMVQRDTTSSDQVDVSNNLDWHDNRVMTCSLAPGKVAVVYPVEWDEGKDAYTWFPAASEGDEARESFIANAQPDASAWSFSYQIALVDTRSGIISGGACSDDAQGVVSDGGFVSTRSVREGEAHTVEPKVTVAPACADHSTPILTLRFTGLENVSYDDFAKDFTLRATVPSNGLNGDRFSSGAALDLEYEVVDAQGGTTAGGVLTSSGSMDSQGNWTIMPTSSSEWRYVYDNLKAGAAITFYAAKGEGIYDFSYALGNRGDNLPVRVESVTDDASGSTLAEDSSGLFAGSSPLVWNASPRHVSLTVSMRQQTVKDPLGMDAIGLPNYGLRFTVDRGGAGDLSEGLLAIAPVLRVTAPSVPRNGELAMATSSVTLAVQRYSKVGGTYVLDGSYGQNNVTSTYPNPGTYNLWLDQDHFSDKSYVYVVTPTTAEAAGEFEFAYQLLGTRGTAWEIDGYGKVDDAADPLAAGISWQAVDALGTYGDRSPVQTLSSYSGGQQAQTLKVGVVPCKAEDKATEINASAPDSVSGTQKDAVVIRNDATGYAPEDTADGMPDIQVSVQAPDYGENTGEPLNWGMDSQLPYQAFLYTYDEGGGTYSPLPTVSGYYHKCDGGANPQSILATYYGNTTGPAHVPWGVAPNGTSTFHTHLADNQAIVLLPRTSPYRFSYQVTVLNPDKYDVKSCEVNGGTLEEERQNHYQSGTISSYGTSSQEVVLDTEKTAADNQSFELLSKSLPFNETMRSLPVTLFDYDFPGLTKADYSGQTSQLKFLYDPLNHYDAAVNHIGDDKTAVFGGIVKGSLDSGGLPVFNYTTPFSLFDSIEVPTETNGGTKTVQPAGFQFVYDTDTNTYSYNSHFHHAQLDDDGIVHQYDHSLGLSGWGSKAAGFFPFNRWETAVGGEEGTWGTASDDDASTYLLEESHLDYHFGLSMAEGFTVPAGGKVKGNDMVFSFSGDDDVWLFMDGKLVLDMGGIHEAVEGKVNLTKGTYEVNGIEHSLKEALDSYSDFGDEGSGAWSAGTKHSFSLFYLERGGTLSNLDISFNLPVTTTLTGTKAWSDQSNAANARVEPKLALHNDKGLSTDGYAPIWTKPDTSTTSPSTTDDWTYEYDGLPSQDEAGDDVTWWVTEDTAVPGYAAAAYSNVGSHATLADGAYDGGTITNVRSPQPTTPTTPTTPATPTTPTTPATPTTPTTPATPTTPTTPTTSATPPAPGLPMSPAGDIPATGSKPDAAGGSSSATPSTGDAHSTTPVSLAVVGLAAVLLGLGCLRRRGRG